MDKKIYDNKIVNTLPEDIKYVEFAKEIFEKSGFDVRMVRDMVYDEYPSDFIGTYNDRKYYVDVKYSTSPTFQNISHIKKYLKNDHICLETNAKIVLFVFSVVDKNDSN